MLDRVVPPALHSREPMFPPSLASSAARTETHVNFVLIPLNETWMTVHGHRDSLAHYST